MADDDVPSGIEKLLMLRQRGYGIIGTMTSPSRTFVVRRCRIGDASKLSDFLKTCWHAAYDRILGEPEAARIGRRIYAKVSLGLAIAYALVSRRTTALVATQGDALVGYAMAQRDETGQIILHGLYVHPERQAKGIGSALVQTVVAGFPGAGTVRLEVLKENAAAIAWYLRQGFEIYGETGNATGMAGVPSLYMDKQLVAQSR